MQDRILIIDDDEGALKALGTLFGSEGYEVVTAPDGSTAISQLARFTPDLIITDLHMPHLGGLDVIRAIRAQADFADTPIIVMSATDDQRERVGVFQEEADDFVSKPVDLDDLLARAKRQLRRHSHEVEHARRSVADELTHVLNRRGLENLFARESERCKREGTSLSVLFIDLDGFKKINDSFGHMHGDVALCAVATSLQDEVRATDRVGRLGGDEFLVLMPGAPEHEAHAVASRIRARLPLEVPIDEQHCLSVDLSLGTATRMPDESFSDLVARADRSMYEDKRRIRRSAR